MCNQVINVGERNSYLSELYLETTDILTTPSGLAHCADDKAIIWPGCSHNRRLWERSHGLCYGLGMAGGGGSVPRTS